MRTISAAVMLGYIGGLDRALAELMSVPPDVQFRTKVPEAIGRIRSVRDGLLSECVADVAVEQREAA